MKNAKCTVSRRIYTAVRQRSFWSCWKRSALQQPHSARVECCSWWRARVLWAVSNAAQYIWVFVAFPIVSMTTNALFCVLPMFMSISCNIVYRSKSISVKNHRSSSNEILTLLTRLYLCPCLKILLRPVKSPSWSGNNVEIEFNVKDKDQSKLKLMVISTSLWIRYE